MMISLRARLSIMLVLSGQALVGVHGLRSTSGTLPSDEALKRAVWELFIPGKEVIQLGVHSWEMVIQTATKHLARTFAPADEGQLLQSFEDMVQEYREDVGAKGNLNKMVIMAIWQSALYQVLDGKNWPDLTLPMIAYLVEQKCLLMPGFFKTHKTQYKALKTLVKKYAIASRNEAFPFMRAYFDAEEVEYDDGTVQSDTWIKGTIQKVEEDGQLIIKPAKSRKTVTLDPYSQYTYLVPLTFTSNDFLDWSSASMAMASDKEFPQVKLNALEYEATHVVESRFDDGLPPPMDGLPRAHGDMRLVLETCMELQSHFLQRYWLSDPTLPILPPSFFESKRGMAMLWGVARKVWNDILEKDKSKWPDRTPLPATVGVSNVQSEEEFGDVLYPASLGEASAHNTILVSKSRMAEAIDL